MENGSEKPTLNFSGLAIEKQRLALAIARDLTCDCGSKEFRPVEVLAIKYDPLNPHELQISPGHKFRCFTCGFYAMFNDKKRIWEFFGEGRE